MRLAAGPDAPRSPGNPGLERRVSDSIHELDLFSEADTVAHVVWVERTGAPGGSRPPRQKYWYQAWRRSTGHWTEPIPIAVDERWDRGVQVTAENGELHAFIGRRLRHFVSDNRGGEWRELAPLTADSLGIVGAFDVVPVARGLVAAYLGRERLRDLSRRTGVWSVMISGESTGTPVRIAAKPRTSNVAPCASLVRHGSDLELIYALYEREGGSPPTKFFHTSSTDEGRTWSFPDEITRNVEGGGLKGLIEHYRTVKLGKTLMIYYSGGYLRAIERGTGGRGEPRVIGGTRHPTDRVTSAGTGGHHRLVWIDDRYKREDWWRFEYPYWANNDVFSITVSPSDPYGSRSKLIRLTREMSYTTALGSAPWRDSVMVVWAGRKKVGRSATSYNEPPTLFWTTLSAK